MDALNFAYGEKIHSTASDSSSDDTEQLDLEGIEQALRDLPSKTVQKSVEKL